MVRVAEGLLYAALRVAADVVALGRGDHSYYNPPFKLAVFSFAGWKPALPVEESGIPSHQLDNRNRL